MAITLPGWIRTPLAATTSAVGTALHLPEMGISEAIQDPTRSVFTASPNNLSTGPTGGSAPSSGGTVQGATTDNSLTGGAGGTGGSGTGYAVPTPSAAILAQFDASKNQIEGDAGTSGMNAANSYNTGARTLFNTIQTGQTKINQERENAALNRMKSVNDLILQIRQGLQSGSVRLGNSNALDSSAAGAIAKAYGDYGGVQRGNIMSDEMLANRQADTEQGDLSKNKDETLRQLQTARDAALTSISTDVANKLQALDAQGQGAGIVGRMNIDAEKQKVVDAAHAQLQGVDDWIASTFPGITSESLDAANATANDLFQKGQVGTGGNPLADAPTVANNVGQGQDNLGAAISQLPLFLRPKTNQNAPF